MSDYHDDEDWNLNGCMLALLLSLILWAVIIWASWWLWTAGVSID